MLRRDDVERLHLGSGHVLAIDGDRLLYDGRPTTARELSRRYPAGGTVWTWLLERGIRRVSTTSGPSGEVRWRTKRRLSLSPGHAERLDALAARLGCTASSVVEQAIDELDRALAENRRSRQK